MSFERIHEIEKYLNKKKNQTPANINVARTHLLMLAEEMSEEELKNVRIYYKSQISSSGMIGNSLTIMAILISIFACLIGLLPNFYKPQEPFYIYYIAFLLLIVLAFTIITRQLNKHLGKTSKLVTTYSIIIELIDELIQK